MNSWLKLALYAFIGVIIGSFALGIIVPGYYGNNMNMMPGQMMNGGYMGHGQMQMNGGYMGHGQMQMNGGYMGSGQMPMNGMNMMQNMDDMQSGMGMSGMGGMSNNTSGGRGMM